MLLEKKIAIIYGGGGAIGAAIARGFAQEGATVHLAGRTAASLEPVAAHIRSEGGRAETAVLDALDAVAVRAHADAVVAESGRLDISCNVISYGDTQGTAVAEMQLEDFERPVLTAVRTHFVTAQAAAGHMIGQGSGVLMMFGGAGGRDPLRDYMTGGHQVFLGGFQVANGAMDVFRRQLAAELGPQGVRVVTIESAGVPETIGGEWREMLTEGLIALTMLKQPETLEDVGNVAAFAASDKARSMTGTSFNISYGRQAD